MVVRWRWTEHEAFEGRRAVCYSQYVFETVFGAKTMRLPPISIGSLIEFWRKWFD